jgi:hypothetical protein
MPERHIGEKSRRAVESESHGISERCVISEGGEGEHHFVIRFPGFAFSS